MNLRIITKNLAADSKIGSPLIIDFRADWTHESNPTAWELSISLPERQRSKNFHEYEQGDTLDQYL